LIQPDECISVIAALAKVYLAYVNQAGRSALADVSSRSQKKPRMKHLLQDWGVERYLQQVNQHLPRPLRQVESCPMPPSTQRYAYLGVHPQRQTGLSYIGAHLRLGQLTATQLRELVQLAKTFGSRQLRLTPWQTVLLPDIPDEQVSDVLQNLASIGLPVSDNRADAAIVACAGKPGCAASATETQSHAITLAKSLSQHLTLESPVNIHLTGCSKSCAQPSPAEITLLGTQISTKLDEDKQKNSTVEGYRIYIGANSSSHGGSEPETSQHHLCDVTEFELTSLINQLLNLYKQQRSTSNESFGEFASRFREWKVGSGEWRLEGVRKGEK